MCKLCQDIIIREQFHPQYVQKNKQKTQPKSQTTASKHFKSPFLCVQGHLMRKVERPVDCVGVQWAMSRQFQLSNTLYIVILEAAVSMYLERGQESRCYVFRLRLRHNIAHVMFLLLSQMLEVSQYPITLLKYHHYLLALIPSYLGSAQHVVFFHCPVFAVMTSSTSFSNITFVTFRLLFCLLDLRRMSI